MLRRTPRSTLTDTRFPSPSLFLSRVVAAAKAGAGIFRVGICDRSAQDEPIQRLHGKLKVKALAPRLAQVRRIGKAAPGQRHRLLDVVPVDQEGAGLNVHPAVA